MRAKDGEGRGYIRFRQDFTTGNCIELGFEGLTKEGGTRGVKRRYSDDDDVREGTSGFYDFRKR